MRNYCFTLFPCFCFGFFDHGLYFYILFQFCGSVFYFFVCVSALGCLFLFWDVYFCFLVVFFCFGFAVSCFCIDGTLRKEKQRSADKMAAYFLALEEIVVNLSLVFCSV